MLEKTWRWFGRKDKITLDMLRQIGVEGIVTALHDIPNGEIWSYEAIKDLQNYIESYGMRWSVVESLPVCESIKYGGPDRDELIEKYKISLANLGKAGVKTICYNFMPVLDWARTDLENPNGNGTSSLYFNHAEFAYFDCHILKRPGAEKDYTAETLAKTEDMKARFTPTDEHRLVENIIEPIYEPGKFIYATLYKICADNICNESCPSVLQLLSLAFPRLHHQTDFVVRRSRTIGDFAEHLVKQPIVAYQSRQLIGTEFPAHAGQQIEQFNVIEVGLRHAFEQSPNGSHRVYKFSGSPRRVHFGLGVFLKQTLEGFYAFLCDLELFALFGDELSDLTRYIQNQGAQGCGGLSP